MCGDVLEVVAFFNRGGSSLDSVEGWSWLLAACRHLPTCLPALWPLAANTTRLSITAEENTVRENHWGHEAFPHGRNLLMRFRNLIMQYFHGMCETWCALFRLYLTRETPTGWIHARLLVFKPDNYENFKASSTWQMTTSYQLHINFQNFFGRCWELNMFSSEHGTWVKMRSDVSSVPFWRFRPWIFLTSPTWTWSIGMGIWSLAKRGRFIRLFSGLVVEFCEKF